MSTKIDWIFVGDLVGPVEKPPSFNQALALFYNLGSLLAQASYLRFISLGKTYWLKIEDGDVTIDMIRFYQVKVMWMITIAFPNTMLMIVMGG